MRVLHARARPATAPSVVTRAIAHTSRARRCGPLGTISTNRRSRVPTRSGVSGSATASTATNDHVGQQRQPQRVAMGQLDQLIVTGRVDATGVQVLTAVVRAQVAKRHDPQQLAPSRVGAPGRTRWRPPGDDRDGGGRQAWQQPSAYPVIERRQPLVGIEQDHQSSAVRSARRWRHPRRAPRAPPPGPRARPAATGGARARPDEPRSRPRRRQAST